MRSEELSDLDVEINQNVVIRGLNYASEENELERLIAPEDPRNADDNQDLDEQEKVSPLVPEI